MISKGEFVLPLKLAFQSLTGEFKAGAKRNLKKQFKEVFNET